jgi:hypothetical protein
MSTRKDVDLAANDYPSLTPEGGGRLMAYQGAILVILWWAD